ncbi:MAG: hypothetical protein JXQ87_07270 [Bacteroidia bacterium]
MKKAFLFIYVICSSLLVNSKSFQHVSTLIEQENNSSDYFGFDGEFSGDYFVTAAHRQDLDANGQNDINNNGRVYIYKKINNSYVLIKSISAPDRATENQTRFYFGYKVSIHGDYLVVSGHHASFDANGNNQVSQAGAAYLFKKDQGGKDNWGFVKKIVAPSNRVSNAFFGEDLSINDSIMSIVESKAAYYENNVYVDRRWAIHSYHINKGGSNNWGYETTNYQPNDVSTSDVWSTVELSSDQLIFGSFGQNTVGNNNYRSGGRVHVFNKSYTPNGELRFKASQVLNATDDNSINYFGERIAVENDLMAISAINDGYDENGNNYQAAAGAVYLFSKSNGNWSLTKKIISPQRQSYQWFGKSIGFNADTLLIGAPDFDSTSVDSTYRDAGTVFHFVKGANSSTWNNKGQFYRGLNWRKLEFATALYYNGTDVFVVTGSSAQNVWIPYRLQVFTKQNSAPVQITTTVWNGTTWDNGTPDNTKIAQIDDDITISNDVTCNDLIINNSSEITINNGVTLQVEGNIEGNSVFSGAGELLISGSNMAIESDNSIEVNNMTVDNNYNFQLGGNLTVNGVLTLTKGHIDLGNFNFIVNNNTSFSGGNSNSYLKMSGTGKVLVTQSRGTSRLLPIGFNPYLPIEIEIPGAGNYDNRTYEVTIIDGVYGNPENETSPQSDFTVNKTWFINPTNLASGVSVTVYWPESAEHENFNRSLSSLSYWFEGYGSWINQNFAAANGSDPFNKTVTGVYFSPFADLWFGVGSASSALPVEFTSFEVEHNSFKNSAILNWQTALEENNSHFEVERSFDGQEWEQIGTVNGQGTTFDITDYQFIDNGLPITINNSPITIYYRLKQVDYNGDFEYSETKTLSFKPETLNSFELWPNPVSGNVINFSIVDDYELVTIEGNVIKRELETNKIDISNLAEGAYMLRNKSGQVQTFIRN